MRKDISFSGKHRCLLIAADFTAVDIETAGFSYADSIIELSAVKYRNNIAVNTFSTLIKPDKALEARITQLTGITNDMLADAPRIEDILPDFLSFVGSDIILGHNVNFDISRIDHACELCGLPGLSSDYIDTLCIAKKLYPDLPQYKLQALSNYFSVFPATPHRALADCETAAQCYMRMAASAPVSVSAEISEPVNHTTYAGYKSYIKPSSIMATADAIDETNPLYAKNIVFTGELSVSRKEAMQAAVNVGAIVKSSISKRTDYLVVGAQDIRLVGEDGMSEKEEKAYALNSTGTANIHIISETEFFALINAKGE